MSPTQTGILILVGVALLAAVAFIAQSIENRKRAISLYLMQMKTSCRRAEHLLKNFPPIFLTPDIRNLLLKYLEQKYGQIIELEPESKCIPMLEEVKSQMDTPHEPTPHPEGSITLFKDSDSQLIARAILREFLKFIHEIKNSGELNASNAKFYLNEASRCHARLEYDLELMKARELELTRGANVAIYYYRNIFKGIQKLNGDQTLDRQLYELRTYMSRLAREVEGGDDLSSNEDETASELEVAPPPAPPSTPPKSP